VARNRLFSPKVQTSREARLLFNGYRRFFPRGKSGRGRDTDPSLHLVPSWSISGIIRLPPFRLPSLHAHGLYNYLSVFFVKAKTNSKSIMLLRCGVPNCDTRGPGVPRSLHVTSNAGAHRFDVNKAVHTCYLLCKAQNDSQRLAPTRRHATWHITSVRKAQIPSRV